jgi:hypothetical protein
MPEKDMPSSCHFCPSSKPYSVMGAASRDGNHCISLRDARELASRAPSSRLLHKGLGGIVGAAVCPPNWVVWKDRDGAEGSHSCLFAGESRQVTWDEAQSFCTSLHPGAHLLTFAQVLLRIVADAPLS